MTASQQTSEYLSFLEAKVEARESISSIKSRAHEEVSADFANKYTALPSKKMRNY
jgi:hypothetical protein